MNKRNPNPVLSFRSWGMKVSINQSLIAGGAALYTFEALYFAQLANSSDNYSL